MNGTLIFLAKGTKVYPRIRGTNSVTRYILPEGSCEITNIASYMDDCTWENVVKVVSPGIIKMKVGNVACVFPTLFSIYLTIHIFSSKLSSDDL